MTISIFISWYKFYFRIWKNDDAEKIQFFEYSLISFRLCLCLYVISMQWARKKYLQGIITKNNKWGSIIKDDNFMITCADRSTLMAGLIKLPHILGFKFILPRLLGPVITYSFIYRIYSFSTTIFIFELYTIILIFSFEEIGQN